MVTTSSKMLAHTIREYRYTQKLSQTEVAKLSVSKQVAISAFENNLGSTKLETLFNILAVLKLEPVVQPCKKIEQVENERYEQW